MIEIGSKAPGFALDSDEGVPLSLDSLRGSIVVLYFYPKDDTPGCTTEAIAFSGLKPAYDAAGAVVIGVSKDSTKSKAKFRAKHGLDVRLAADPDAQVIEAYDSWVEKSLYGRAYMGIDRSTFLIDRDGILRRVWRKVKVKGHAEAVLEAVKELG